MHVDHLTFAVGPLGLRAEAERLGALLGTKARKGGNHPHFGTRNRIVPLTHGRYVEIVEVLEHPAAEKAPFGKAVRARSELGGGWLGWAIAVDDLTPIEARLHRESVPASRIFPDGRVLEWHQIGVRGLLSDPQLPFFIRWDSAPELLPSALHGTVELLRLEIAGSRGRVEEWLGAPVGDVFDDVEIHFSAPNGQPGLSAAVFKTAAGTVRI